MIEALEKPPKITFHKLKVVKKELSTKNTFLLELEVPAPLKPLYAYEAGQYLTFRISGVERDFSMVSAPYEENLVFGIKINSANSVADFIYKNVRCGDFIEVSSPKGRFTLASKPHEFRTIIGFAMGIGITPVLSHFKAILHSEPRTRLFLFYGNKNLKDVAFRNEIDNLALQFPERFKVYYFFSQEQFGNGMFFGRLDRKKVKLIINQILHSDDTDEESTIWDAVDEVLICGKGEMIKEVANACFEAGIPKKNIHFELFESFNEDIYPQEKTYTHVENIKVNFKINRKSYTTTLADNSAKILQQLLIQQFPVPYSCKSGICGSCICMLESGEVELFENEYLTEKEEAEGKILTCMAVPLSKNLSLNFDFE